MTPGLVIVAFAVGRLSKKNKFPELAIVALAAVLWPSKDPSKYKVPELVIVAAPAVLLSWNVKKLLLAMVALLALLLFKKFSSPLLVNVMLAPLAAARPMPFSVTACVASLVKV